MNVQNFRYVLFIIKTNMIFFHFLKGPIRLRCLTHIYLFIKFHHSKKFSKIVNFFGH